MDGRRHRRERWAWAAALVVSAGVAAAALLVAFGSSAEAPEPPPAAHFTLDLPEDLRITTNSGARLPAVSPDGRHVAIVGEAGGVSRLWVRSLASRRARALSSTEGARHPFWSPDASSVVFAAEGELRKITLAGGTAQRVCALPRSRSPFLHDREKGVPIFFGGTWNEDGTIVFSSGGDLFAVPGTGGEPRRLTNVDESAGESARLWPQFLPDGRHFLVLVDSTEASTGGLHVASLDAPAQRRRLMRSGGAARYVSGHLLFERDSVVYAQPFDVQRLDITGAAVPVAEDVAFSRSLRFGSFGGSAGVLVHVGAERPYHQLTWLNRAGKAVGTLGEPHPFQQLALSPDGSRAALSVFSGFFSLDLWIMDVSRGAAHRLTSGGGSDPAWSPDGQELIHHVPNNVVRRPLHAGAPAVPLFDTAANDQPQNWPKSWSSDGETLLYIRRNEIWALPLAGGGSPEPVLKSDFEFDGAQLSPDGRWLAYTSNESGDWEAYIEPFRRQGEKIRVSTDGGGQPKWRRDGRELFFVARPNRLMAVEVREATSGLAVGRPSELFEIPAFTRPQGDDYAVSPDGQRILVKAPTEAGSDGKLYALVNWTSLLE